MVRQLLQLVVYEPQGVDSSLRLLRNGIIDLLLDEGSDAVHLTCQESDVLVCALDAVEWRFSHALFCASRYILLSWRGKCRVVRRV